MFQIEKIQFDRKYPPRFGQPLNELFSIIFHFRRNSENLTSRRQLSSLESEIHKILILARGKNSTKLPIEFRIYLIIFQIPEISRNLKNRQIIGELEFPIKSLYRKMFPQTRWNQISKTGSQTDFNSSPRSRLFLERQENLLMSTF